MEDLNVKFNVFTYKDKRLGTYSKPIITDVSKDNYARNAIKAAITAPAAEQAYAKDQVLCFCGVYNDATATFETHEPEVIVDIGEYINGTGKGN